MERRVIGCIIANDRGGILSRSGPAIGIALREHMKGVPIMPDPINLEPAR